MPTNERVLEDVHVEIYAPTGGFIFGQSVFGDNFGGESFIMGLNVMGDALTSTHNDWQWVDYINDAISINYDRGGVNEGASKTVQVGLFNATFKDAADPLTDYKVRAGRAIQARQGDEILFSGTVTKVPGHISRKKNKYTKYFTVQAADTVKNLAAIQVYGAGGLTEPYESFEERIARLLNTYEGPVELPTGDAYPAWKLSATVYESSLASHLDLACNSVGASWYIDKIGQLRFNTVLTDYVTATFSDGTHTGDIGEYYSYYNLTVEYDPKNHINYLEVSNKGIIEDPNNAGVELNAEVSAVYADTSSIESNGYQKSSLVTCLYNEGAYNTSVADRAAAILLSQSTPQPTITKLYFNVQEDFSAAQIETLHLVNVWYEGTMYSLRVTGVSATMNPKEWLLQLDLAKD